ncbi:MAG TPA: aminoacyl-tRNA deacylase [Gaiellaceae bacterium]|jgi:Cys-tRNA(Pro)/Cys-tRNA(Cys) deacylase
MAGKRTPAVAVVEQAGVPYRLHEYALDPTAPSFGLEAASKLDLDPARVFKTLVVATGEGNLLALVPADARLDTKALGKRARLAEPAEAERVTGYVKGGTSALGGRKRLPVVLDESALAWETIVVNAGRRGLQLELAPSDLLALTGGRVARLVAGSPDQGPFRTGL